MNEASLRSHLNLEAERAIDIVQVFDEIDSTNSEALRQIRSGDGANRLIVANSQSAGRGRRGREWLSPQNGVYFSLTRRFDLDADALQGLSLVTAISIVEALHGLGVSGLQVKWPNDVLHKKKKLAGILLELQPNAAAQYVVFGVGVNCELSAEAVSRIDRPVTDLKTLMGALPASDLLLATLLNRLCQNMGNYELNGFSPFENTWNNLDCYRMSDIVIQNGESRLIGKSLGVDATGALLLQSASGIQAISSGEVFPSLRPLSDETNKP